MLFRGQRELQHVKLMDNFSTRSDSSIFKNQFKLCQQRVVLSVQLALLGHQFQQVKSRAKNRTLGDWNTNKALLKRLNIKNYLKLSFPSQHVPAESYQRNTRTRCEICSKLTIKTPERCHWRTCCTRCSSVSFVNFEHVNAGWDSNK